MFDARGDGRGGFDGFFLSPGHDFVVAFVARLEGGVGGLDVGGCFLVDVILVLAFAELLFGGEQEAGFDRAPGQRPLRGCACLAAERALLMRGAEVGGGDGRSGVVVVGGEWTEYLLATARALLAIDLWSRKRKSVTHKTYVTPWSLRSASAMLSFCSS